MPTTHVSIKRRYFSNRETLPVLPSGVVGVRHLAFNGIMVCVYTVVRTMGLIGNIAENSAQASALALDRKSMVSAGRAA